MSTAPEPLLRPTRAEIDLAAYDRNLASMRKRLPAGSRLIAVLKADGYGHGAIELARRCTAGGAAMIGVALYEEAVALQDAGIALPILILGPVTPQQLAEAARRGFILGITGPRQLAHAAALGREVHIHLKLDSGMGRMGLVAPELAPAAKLLRGAPHVKVDALYTHFANASDPEDPFTGVQIERFHAMIEELPFRAPLHHSANSAATVRGLVSPGDWVRIGLALLGGEPLDEGFSRLEPVMRWRSEIARLKLVPAGSTIGYGRTFTAPRESRIATVPVGYADGYDRALSNRGEVLVQGLRAPVVGRVSMDLITIDVTDVPDATEGDEVVLLGRQHDKEISAEEIAKKIGTISYEVFCRVSARVPRVFLKPSRDS